MIGAKRRDRIGAPSIALGICLLLIGAVPAAFAVSSRPIVGRAVVCADTPVRAALAARRGRTDAHARARVEAEISSAGQLTGQTLRLDRTGRARISIPLPVESFVGSRSGDALVYTRDGGGRGSEVHLVDLASGCDTIVARPFQVVRSAIVASDGSAVYVHSVTRSGRRDAGVERYDLATGAVTSAVPALKPSARLGPIHGTQLRWSLDGKSLLVQSCGFAACLTRVLDVANGVITTIDSPGQGAVIGLANGTLVTFATCPGHPCAVLAHELLTGTSSTLAQEAYDARVSMTAQGAVVTITTVDGSTEVSL
jgi:hypothetical protein